MSGNNTTDNRDGAPASWLAAWRVFWRRAERLTVLTGVAFVGSTLVNTLVFDVWGQTFLLIATPMDVLMSGLHLATLPVLLAAGFAAGYVCVVSRQNKTFALLLYIAALVLFGLILARLISYGPAVARLWWIGGFVGWSCGGWNGLESLQARQIAWGATAGLSAHVQAAFDRIGRGVTYGLFAGSYLIVAGVMLWVAQEAGYPSHPVRLSPKDTPADCAGRVLWIGERALLIDCGNYPARDVQVLYGPEGVRLINDVRAWPGAPPPPLIRNVETWLRARPITRQILDAIGNEFKT